jgi:beta-glucosidase
MNGSALAVNAAQQHAAAVLEAWYPGESGGQAIAETVSGKNDPGARLPVTFYASTNQLPPFDDYAMHNRTYRFFTGEPLYRFGYGLSYTQFAYSNLHISPETFARDNTVTVEADLRNTGSVAGDEVAQLYLTTPPYPTAPVYALRAFQRISLAPGETRRLSFKLSPRQLSAVNEDGSRSILAGDYKVAVGGGQPVSGFNGVKGTFSTTQASALPN